MLTRMTFEAEYAVNLKKCRFDRQNGQNPHKFFWRLEGGENHFCHKASGAREPEVILFVRSPLLTVVPESLLSSRILSECLLEMISAVSFSHRRCLIDPLPARKASVVCLFWIVPARFCMFCSLIRPLTGQRVCTTQWSQGRAVVKSTNYSESQNILWNILRINHKQMSTHASEWKPCPWWRSRSSKVYM